MRVFLFVLLVLPALLTADAAGADDVLAKAQRAYSRTDYRASLALLRENGPRNGKAFALAGRDYFMLGDFKKAGELLERAFAEEPSNSEYALWLGRSFGRRAETSSPLFAARYAEKAQRYLEKAASLDPLSEEALNDLFDYYLEAPGFLGGGFDKAGEIAKRISERNPAEGRFAQSRVAERRTQFDTADEQLRRAAGLAPKQVGRLVDLARYLAERGRYSESEAMFDKAEKLAPNSPKVEFARAETYIRQHRDLDRAKALLNHYLRSDLTPEDPPRAEAEKLLKEASGA